MTVVYVLTMVLLSPADEGLHCIVRNVRTYIRSYQYKACVPYSYTVDTFHGEGRRRLLGKDKSADSEKSFRGKGRHTAEIVL